MQWRRIAITVLGEVFSALHLGVCQCLTAVAERHARYVAAEVAVVFRYRAADNDVATRRQGYAVSCKCTPTGDFMSK